MKTKGRGGYVTYGFRNLCVSFGTFTLVIQGGSVLSLKDCLYVPQIKRILISISKLVEHGYTFFFGKNKVSIKFNNRFVACGLKENGLYLHTLAPNFLACENGSTICITNTSKRKRDEIVPTYRAH